MNDSKPKTKKFRDKGKLQDVMRKETFSHSLDDVLNVKKAPIVEKQTSCGGALSRLSINHGKCAEASSSNDSFCSAMSQNLSPEINYRSNSFRESQKERPPVPSIYHAPSKPDQSPEKNLSICTDTQNISPVNLIQNDPIENEESSQVDIMEFDETLPSCDEEIVAIDTKILKVELFESNALHILSSKDATVKQNKELEYAKLFSNAASSQAFFETLADDSSAQIGLLMKIRDEEMTLNQSLRTRVAELENLKENMDGLVADLESSYQETYSELSNTHNQELEFLKMESKIESTAMEHQIIELSGKLLISESQNLAKDELVNDLNSKIQDLENSLEQQELHCQEELQGVIAKVIKNESIASAKNEVEEECITNLGNNVGAQLSKRNQDIIVNNVSTFIEDVVSDAEKEIQWESNYNYSNLTTNFDRAAMVADLRRASMEFSCEDNLNTPVKYKRNSSSKGKNISKKSEISRNSLESHIPKLNKTNAIHDSKQENSQLKTDLEYTQKNNKELEISVSTKNELLGEEQKMEIEKETLSELNNLVKVLELSKAELESRVTDMKEKIVQLESDKNSSVLKRVSLDALVDKLQKENEILLSTNNELKLIVDNIIEHKDKCSILEAELENFKNMSSPANLELELSSVQKELNDLRSSLRLTNPSISEKTRLNYTDATQYMDYFLPPQIPIKTQTYVEAAAQTDLLTSIEAPIPENNEKLDASKYAAARRFTADEFCTSCRPRSSRRSSLDLELQMSWTERCEVEQQLAKALAKIETLQKYKAQLEKIGLHASSLVEAGVPSAAVWLQLRSCIKELNNDLTELQNAKMEIEGKTYYLIPNSDSKNPFDSPPLPPHIINNNLVGQRSSPEGGRESPKPTDGQSDSTIEDDPVSSEDVVDIQISQDLVLDKPAEAALFEMVQDLLRCLGNDDLNCSVNSTLSASLCEKMATVTDAGELCRCWQQVKEEVARISALSSKIDPTAKLQEEVRSLEQQVIASDKQVRLTRAFLEEQASEREVERDEAAQRINELTELVRTKDRQLAAKQHLSQDVEVMTQQLSEVQAALEFENKKRTSLEFSIEQNCQKVATLREIIDTLEIQLAECNDQLQTAREDNIKLQKQLIQNSHQSLEREDAQRDSFSDTLVYVARLEEELTSLQHRINATGPESIAYARTAIRDLETVVGRRTRQLELVQVPWNAGLSSASEELSTRDHADITRCVTPDEMAVEPGVGLCEDVERLKERILKHARVEEAALKKMKELEVASAKRDELQFDLEAAMLRVDELLSENGSIKARLDKERSRPQDHFVAADLEMKVRSLENELERVAEELQAEKKLVLEKARREERLQESLESREIEVLEETKALRDAQERLKQEKDQRLAVESRMYELNKMLEEKIKLIGELHCLMESQSRELSNLSQLSDKKIENILSTSENKLLELSNLCEQKSKELESLRVQSDNRLLEMSALCEQKDKQIEELRNATELHLQELSSMSDSGSKKGSIEIDLNETENLPHLNLSSLKRHVATSKNSSSSSSSSKKVRFCNPESFVGSSLTPISRSSPSVLRDHQSYDEQWGDLEHTSRKPFAWESISSVAALHLSPRGAQHNDDSNTFYSPIPNNSSSQPPINESFPDLKHRLKSEIALLQSKLTTSTKLLESSEENYKREVEKLTNELAKSKEKAIYDCEKIENARKNSEESLNQLKMQFDNCQLLITEQKAEIKSLENQLKSSKNNEEKEKQKGLVIIADLQSQVDSITEELKKQQKEVLSMKNILKETVDELSSVRSARDEIALSEKHLTNEVLELEKQKRINTNLNNQIKVLNGKIQESSNIAHDIDIKNKELKLVKQALSAKNEEIASFRKEIAAKLEVFEKDSKRLNEMEQIIKEYEETINKVVSERDHLKFDNVKFSAVMQTMQRERNLAKNKSNDERDGEESEKLIIDAANKVSDLSTCLEKMTQRSASLEANLFNVRTQLATSENKAASLQTDLLLATRQIDELTRQLQIFQNSPNNQPQQMLDTSRLRSDQMADQLESVQNQLMHYQRKDNRQVKKLQEELMVSKRIENELRTALKTNFELEKDMALREASLKDKLNEAEKELLRLQFASELKDVNVRGFEKLHHHTLALRTRPIQNISGAANRDLRSVRSAGDGEDRPSEMQWTIHRLESYRKQLVWQKRFLQDSKGRVFPRRNGRRSLRVVALVVIAIHRMHFLVRRWKHAFKLPPLVSPPRREKDGLLMLTSPPCRDTNHRLNQIN